MADNDKVGLRHMVPSLLSGIATALTAAAGLIGVLYQTGYLGHATPAPAVDAVARAPQQTPNQIAPLAAVDAPGAPRIPAAGSDNSPPGVTAHPRVRNINGAWRDGASNCHQIKQIGRQLTVSSYFADNGRLWAIGGGTLKGGVVSMRLNAANPDSPEADLILSQDGRELSGMVKGAKGVHVARWRFAGPSCVQTAARPE